MIRRLFLGAVAWAARLGYDPRESEDVRGQVGPATHSLIKDDFVCDRRGMVNVKGKGEMKTWYVDGKAHA